MSTKGSMSDMFLGMGYWRKFLNGEKLTNESMKEDDSLTPLHVAASQADFEQVESLIAQGWDINATDAVNATAMHYAAAGRGKQFFQVARVLRQAGADLEWPDKFGFTPKRLVQAPRAKGEL